MFFVDDGCVSYSRYKSMPELLKQQFGPITHKEKEQIK